MPKKKKRGIVKRRPAESGSLVAGAVVILLDYFFGPFDAKVILALTTIVAAIPTGITTLVEKFGGGKQVVDAIE